MQKIADYWNKQGNLPKIIKLSTSRKRKLQARLKEDEFAKRYEEIIDLVARTPFLCGYGNKGWVATFDWLIHNDENYLKVLEQRYGKPSGTIIVRGTKKTPYKTDGSDTDWDEVSRECAQG